MKLKRRRTREKKAKDSKKRKSDVKRTENGSGKGKCGLNRESTLKEENKTKQNNKLQTTTTINQNKAENG